MKESRVEMGIDMPIDLPLVKLTAEDVYGAFMVHDTDSYTDWLLKLQTWIMNFAEEQVKPLRDSGQFTETEIDAIKKKNCVVSPLTLTLYLHWLQMETFIKMTDEEKEREFLSKFPGRFRARFKGNAANRNAREVDANEEAEVNEESSAERMERMRKMSFAEFLKETYGRKR